MKPAFHIAVFGVVALHLMLTGQQAGLRINTSNSMPIGVWRVQPLAAPVRRGDVVTVCLPDSPAAQMAAVRRYVPAGSCPDGREPLVKAVAAAGGDVVVVRPAGVTVNGVAVINSAQLEHDTGGRPMLYLQAGAHQVEPGEIWLLATRAKNSWDSRYFGGVPVASVTGIARPVWVR